MEFYPVHDLENFDSARDSGSIGWDDERPPTYNPEDYSAHLTRYYRKCSGCPNILIIVVLIHVKLRGDICWNTQNILLIIYIYLI